MQRALLARSIARAIAITTRQLIPPGVGREVSATPPGGALGCASRAREMTGSRCNGDTSRRIDRAGDRKLYPAAPARDSRRVRSTHSRRRARRRLARARDMTGSTSTGQLDEYNATLFELRLWPSTTRLIRKGRLDRPARSCWHPALGTSQCDRSVLIMNSRALETSPFAR